jgi:signal transduction histidine kinase
MGIDKYITNSYIKVHPFEGVCSVEEILLEKEYLVVINDDDEFLGILTPNDLIKRPHKIVIDCVTEKEYILHDETIISVLNKFNKNQCSALPVLQGNKFVGIIEKYNLINKLKFKINELYDKSIISENVKTSFLNNLSHEIRTPLNGLLGFIEIVSGLDVDGFKVEGRGYCKIIRNSADRFLLIMNDLIDLALINSGDNIKVVREDVRIEDIFLDLKEYFEKVTSLLNKNVTVHFANPDTSLFIFTDSEKIKHILYHLIDNAIKFSIGNKVLISYVIENQNIVFSVTNNGVKLNEVKMKKIFDVFENPYIKNDENLTGIGIGLPLVKKLSELLEGDIDFINNETQTIFFCTLPLKSKTASCI